MGDIYFRSFKRFVIIEIGPLIYTHFLHICFHYQIRFCFLCLYSVAIKTYHFLPFQNFFIL